MLIIVSFFIFCRYLNIYEQIHFLGEDPKTVDARRDDDGPIRKKHCGSQYNVPLTYNHAQHDVAGKWCKYNIYKTENWFSQEMLLTMK